MEDCPHCAKLHACHRGVRRAHGKHLSDVFRERGRFAIDGKLEIQAFLKNAAHRFPICERRCKHVYISQASIVIKVPFNLRPSDHFLANVQGETRPLGAVGSGDWFGFSVTFDFSAVILETSAFIAATIKRSVGESTVTTTRGSLEK